MCNRMEIRGVSVHVTSTLSYPHFRFFFFLFELRGLPRIRPSGMNSSQGAIQMYCNYMASSRQQKSPFNFLYIFSFIHCAAMTVDRWCVLLCVHHPFFLCISKGFIQSQSPSPFSLARDACLFNHHTE